jgi:putative RecB family exonuclease
MTTYSHSRLSTFEQCRYKYKLQYIDKIKVDVPTTIEAFMGDMVHQTLEKLYSDLKFQKMNALSELLVFFNELWNKEYSNDILIAKSEYSADNYRKMGEKYITDYYSHYHPFDDIKIIGLETEERMTLSDGITYHVRIDKLGFIGTMYYVCDYKTNVRMKTQEDADMDRQLAMYSIWVKDKFPDATSVVLKWHMLAFDKEVVSSRTPTELDALKKEVLELISIIENCKDYPTTVTKLCDYCVYQDICPSFKHNVELDIKTPELFKEDDGLKLVNQYAELTKVKSEVEESLETVKEDLIAFAQSKGIDVVYGSNKKVSVKEYTKIVMPEDKDELIELLKEKGLYEEFTMLNYMKFNSAVTKGVIDVGDLVTKEKEYRVSMSNKKIDEA